MVVDDEEPMRKLLRVNLTVEGYDVVTATDGGSALALLGEHKPDLVILDAMMPKVDGFTIAERLRREDETRVIPIVMVTSLREVVTKVNSLLKVKDYNDHIRDHQRELEAELAKRTEELQQADWQTS